jgi:GcrA cell cycle regulator
MSAPTRNSRAGNIWSEERIGRLRTRWQESATAGQISTELSRESGLDISRSAVIGKLHRLGLLERRRAPKPQHIPRAPRPHRPPPVVFGNFAAAIPVRKTEPPPEPVVNPDLEADPSPPDKPGVTLVELLPHHCRWPIGDPHSPDFRFCGERRADPDDPRRQYCARHEDMASAAVQRRRVVWFRDKVSRETSGAP